jgi:hypothetical protein
MDQIIISRRYEAAASLAELAGQINSEHGHVVDAVRDGLEHARKAGVLLLQAKSRVPQGNWLAWVRANCTATPRSVQRYIRLAERWDEIVARGGERFGIAGALKLLTRPASEGPAPNATRVSHLPAALAYYRDQGLLNDAALSHLLRLADDLGPEILCELRFLRPDAPPVGEFTEAWWFFNDTRPLDHPTLWPWPLPGEPDIPAVTAAVQLFFEDGRARNGRMPQWEFVALWFASRVVWLIEKTSWSGDRIASILETHLHEWRESIRTALVRLVLDLGIDFDKVGPEDHKEWWGYHSDLRHAGVITAAEEMKANPQAHPVLFRSLEAGVDDMFRVGSYPLPSSFQHRLDRCLDESQADDADDAELVSAPSAGHAPLSEGRDREGGETSAPVQTDVPPTDSATTL